MDFTSRDALSEFSVTQAYQALGVCASDILHNGDEANHPVMALAHLAAMIYHAHQAAETAAD